MWTECQYTGSLTTSQLLSPYTRFFTFLEPNNPLLHGGAVPRMSRDSLSHSSFYGLDYSGGPKLEWVREHFLSVVRSEFHSHQLDCYLLRMEWHLRPCLDLESYQAMVPLLVV